MNLRGKSKDRSRKVTPPGPSYMSNDQFASYLADLRNSRIARPSGARPLKPSAPGRRDTDQGVQTPQAKADDPTPGEQPPRSESVLSHRPSQPAFSSMSSRTGRPLVPQPQSSAPLKPSQVVPSATYMERGQRWMEKEEAVSLRDALEDMDIKKEDDEAMLHAAAQEEASELVWQHQNPGADRRDGPYKYKEHLRKNSYAHARTRSVGRYSGIGLTGLARDTAPRSVSGGSQGSRVSSGSSNASEREVESRNENRKVSLEARNSIDSVGDFQPTRKSQKSYGGLSNTVGSAGRRRSSGRRNISGEPAGSFTTEQIWEEPETEELNRGRSPPETKDIPAPLRLKTRNPLNRVQFAQEPPRSNSTPVESIKKVSRYEIHQNPPSQSRNPAYTANPPPAAVVSPTQADLKDGLEIRGEDIRQATSMRLKDRSAKLPTPTAVSNKPGRPIVSFDADWKPKEADLKPVEEYQRPRLEQRVGPPYEKEKALPAFPPTKAVPAFHIPTINFPNSPPVQVNHSPTSSTPTITTSPIDIPKITTSPIDIPSINFPGVPTINVSSTLSNNSPNIPSINLPDAPVISISVPVTTPTIVNHNPSRAGTSRPLPQPKTSTRPLPDPRTASSRPIPTAAPRSHWSPAAGNRATATCHQCRLPIEGHVVALHGAPERFHPHCFACHICGTSLEALEIRPEPTAKRTERLSRIQRRAHGEQLPDELGESAAEDGDSRLRFYCHLDWHELFAPRCKHCKSTIIGKHTVALGEHWHDGHFFCAECGDPFQHGMTHIEKDGYAWCLSCQTKRTERQAPKCWGCKKPVIGQYVVALGGEWHDECFRCADCGDGFGDGNFFPRERATAMLVLCRGCVERDLKA